MGFLKALALLIAIPIFGFGVSKWVLWDINTALEKNGVELSLGQLCSQEVIATDPASLTPLCDDVRPILWMQDASIFSGIVAILLLLSFMVAATLAGKDRTRMAKIFPPLVFFSLLVLAGLVLVQGAILTYGAYLAESTAIQRVHFILIGGIGLAALFGGVSLIISSFKMAAKQNHFVMGEVLDPEHHSKLYTYIRGLAERLGARPPEHIVVGLEPNFYVTSADVQVAGREKPLTGETLFLSLPLARIFSPEEITAVVGHELGHFRGQDTFYSLKFSPVYSGLTHAVSKMESPEEGGGADSIATLPALSMLSFMIDVFHTNVSAISREREFEADKAAAEVAMPQALATSLLKISLYGQAWNTLQEHTVARLTQGKTTRNLSQLFSSTVRYDVNRESLPQVIDTIAQETIAHPTDSHPPTVHRIQALGLSVDDIDHQSLLIPEECAIDLIQDHRALEERLTILQQQYYVSLGVEVPEDEESRKGESLLAAFGAHMVLADGKVVSEEIDQAESIGMDLSEHFDHISFREFCHYPESLPSIEELISLAAGRQLESRKRIFEYLEKIAHADTEVSPEETTLLKQIQAQFSL